MMFQHDPNGYLYLASPYTHPDPAVRQWRYEQAVLAVGKLMAEKIWVFSPIVQTHPVCVANALPPEFEHYEHWDQVMIQASSGLLVLQLEGWEQSKGIEAEIKYACTLHKTIQFYGWLHKYEQQ